MAVVMHSGYMPHVHAEPDDIVERARDLLKGHRFDTLVGIGLSGALVVPILARGLNKRWLIVRKPNDGSHARMSAEGTLGSRWVFVDDFISTGRTLRRAKEGVYQTARSGSYRRGPAFNTRFVGAYLYENFEFKPASELTRYQRAGLT